MKRRARAAVAISAAVAAAVGLGVLATSASAEPASLAAAPTTLPASQYTLSANYHQFDAVNAALVSDARHRAGAHRDGQREPRPHGAAVSLSVAGLSTGFRFDSGDNSDCTNYPQGITTSRDAVGTANSGNYDGHQLVAGELVHQGRLRRRARPAAGSPWSTGTPPTRTSTARSSSSSRPAPRPRPNFKDIPIHAGGVSWYGDYLYVADTGHGMRVFDMRKILKTNTGGTADQIGHQSGTLYYAHNYAYVLPQIGTITSNTTSGTNLSWSSISLDRVSKSIVMAEYTCQSGCTDYPNRAPRAIRYPFASVRRRSPRRRRPARRCSCPGTTSTAWRRTTAAGGSTRPGRSSSTTGRRRSGSADVLLGQQRRKPVVLGGRHQRRPAVDAAGERRATATSSPSRRPPTAAAEHRVPTTVFAAVLARGTEIADNGPGTGVITGARPEPSVRS